ncbi:MAG: metallophosphoesterase [Eubacterium sp.]|nr:metallophosphoesterase [Eubacterium sp.]
MKFYQITDLHYYPARLLKAEGKEWVNRAMYDQKCIAESEAILDAAIQMLLDDKEVDIILITGDNVCDGERVGHISLAEKLHKLTNAGKKVYIITGTHDLHPEPKGYSKEKGEYVVDGCTREELEEIYGDFGFNDAIAKHPETFSYVSQLDDNTRLLALNDDGIGWEDGFHGYFEEQLNWIKEQIADCRKAGQKMIAITHHPLLAPSPIYEFYCKNQMLGDNEKIANLFADNDIHFVFTGHTHMQNINYFDTPKGNRVYDINTASLIGYPSPIRKMELDDNKLTVKTLHPQNVKYDFGSKSYMTYSRDHFDFMLKDIIDSAANDIDRFVEVAECFSLHREQAEKIKVPIHILGKLLDTLTFKKAGTVLMCKSKIAPRMYNVRLADFIITLVRNIYAGDEPYAPGSAEYDSFMAIYDRLSPIIHKIFKGDEIDDVIKGILYDDGFPDSDAVLEVPEFIN